MTWLRVIASACAPSCQARALDREFDDELRDHLESLPKSYEAAGRTTPEARRAAV